MPYCQNSPASSILLHYLSDYFYYPLYEWLYLKAFKLPLTQRLFILLLRSLINQVHKLVELRRDDDLCATIALLAHSGSI